MIEIYLNGEKHSLSGSTYLSDLINHLQLQDKRIAVEVNLNVVPRSQFPQYTLNSGDQVEIVQAIGGG